LNNSCNAALSTAEKSGIIALLAALFFFLVHPLLAVIPLVIFLLFCLTAPFFPRSCFYLPVISRGKGEESGVCLTFDDGPSPSSTPVLLELLDRYGLVATFFVVGEKAEKYPEIIASIVSGGHTIGNHSWKHDSFLMLRSKRKLAKDIHRTQEVLTASGIRTHVFRPPAAVTGPRLGRVLAGEVLTAVTYSCRAMDRGNRNIRNLAAKILDRLRSGDIILLHDLVPPEEDQFDHWQRELDLLFADLQENHNVVSLNEIIQQPVMTVLSRKSVPSPGKPVTQFNTPLRGKKNR